MPAGYPAQGVLALHWQGMTPFALRPPEVTARILPGHWEADFIKGAANGSVAGIMVECTSRCIMLPSLHNASATTPLDGFSRRLRSVSRCLRKTSTDDQDAAMARHQDLARRLRMEIYFCDPTSPWQRGTNKKTRGLIREYLPEGAELNADSDSDSDLRRFEGLLNNRPRTVLGFHTPAEAFAEFKFGDLAGVALQARHCPHAEVGVDLCARMILSNDSTHTHN